MTGGQLDLEFPEPKLPALLTVDEVFDRLDQGLLESMREDRRIERKPASYHGPALGEYLSMWGNTSPDGGIMALGVADDGSIIGCHGLSHDQLNKAEQMADLCPDVRVVTKRIPVVLAGGVQSFVLAARVFYLKRRVARTPQGAVCIRCGDQKRTLKEDEIRQLQIDKGEVSFEQEPCGLKYPDDFDISAIQEWADSVRKMKELTTNPSIDELLVASHLATWGNPIIPNMACALLFAKEPDRLIPGCRIRFLRFDGDTEYTGERRNAVRDDWITGLSVPKLIENAEKRLDAQIRSFSALGKDGKFYIAPEYPKPAWYEAIVNACVHRAYGNGLRNATVFIRMFDNRLEIDSPGSFPPFITPENIVGSSHPRNPKLMEAMYFLRFVKMAGEGTRRIVETMREAQLPAPAFEEKHGDGFKVRVTLRNNIEQRRVWVDSDVTATIGAEVARTLAEDQKRMLNFIIEYGSINVTQAVRITQQAWETAKKSLESLVGLEILERVQRPGMERDPHAKYVLRKTAAKGQKDG